MSEGMCAELSKLQRDYRFGLPWPRMSMVCGFTKEAKVARMALGGVVEGAIMTAAMTDLTNV